MEKKLYFAPETVVTDINIEIIMQKVSGGDNVPTTNEPAGDDEEATAKSAFNVWDDEE